jgi:alkanesulfonate monooxygenase SsuD/methylene tetrahydromethanopterin reductase-like flavin-dependent oxidoreductase (luciferase family)
VHVVAQQVDFGIYIPQISFEFEEILSRARLCEQLGVTSFWLYDHLYTPGLPQFGALEGWTLATALLMQTSTLRVGHLVVNNNLRHPALLGRMATTLDVLSGGRLELGMGSGSYEAEHHEGGFPWGTLGERSERLAEGLEIITRMFAAERTTFAGRYFQVHDLPNLPRPVQTPRPPIHVGGIGARYTLPLAARYADVWNVPTYGLGQCRPASIALDAACEQEGRDPASLRRSLEAVLALAEDQAGVDAARTVAERRYAGPGWGLDDGGFIGTPQAIVDRIGGYLEAGFTYFVFFPYDRGGEAMLQLLASDVMPHFK